MGECVLHGFPSHPRVAFRSLERHKLRSILTMLGIVIGIVVEVLLSGTVARLMGWPRFISFSALATAAVFSAGVGIFFGYYPVGKAARLDPIEAL